MAAGSALALREASVEVHAAPWLGWIAERVTKVDGSHPSWAALSQLFASVLQHRDDVALNRPEDVEPGGTRAEPAEALANSEIQDVEPGGTRAGTRQFC